MEKTSVAECKINQSAMSAGAANNKIPVACVASVSVGFRSKELPREKRAERGRGRKEGNAC